MHNEEINTFRENKNTLNIVSEISGGNGLFMHEKRERERVCERKRERESGWSRVVLLRGPFSTIPTTTPETSTMRG